jgi:hypothetical protein
MQAETYTRLGTGCPASNKARGKQHNIPTSYILEIDSYVFKSVQVSSPSQRRGAPFRA